MPNYTARLVGKDARGRKVYRVPVVITLNNSRGSVLDWTDPPRSVLYVLSHSAADAANYAARIYATRAETEICAFGPAGGKTRRFIGWHSAIGAAMFAPRDETPRLV